MKTDHKEKGMDLKKEKEQNQQKKKIICHFCKKVGHKIKTCRKRNQRIKNKKQQQEIKREQRYIKIHEDNGKEFKNISLQILELKDRITHLTDALSKIMIKISTSKESSNIKEKNDRTSLDSSETPSMKEKAQRELSTKCVKRSESSSKKSSIASTSLKKSEFCRRNPENKKHRPSSTSSKAENGSSEEESSKESSVSSTQSKRSSTSSNIKNKKKRSTLTDSENDSDSSEKELKNKKDKQKQERKKGCIIGKLCVNRRNTADVVLKKGKLGENTIFITLNDQKEMDDQSKVLAVNRREFDENYQVQSKKTKIKFNIQKETFEKVNTIASELQKQKKKKSKLMQRGRC